MFKTLLSLVALAGLAGDAHAARVQVVHLSPDAPNVDVWVDGAVQHADVPYLGATRSRRVAADVYNLDVSATGDVNPVLSAQVPLSSGTSTTVAVWDELANIQPALLDNDINGLPAGHIRLQVTHTAVGVGMVDIWDLTSGAKLVDDFDFGAIGRLDVPAGAYELGLDLDEDAVADVTFSVPDLGTDTLVNVFAISDIDGVALFAVYLNGTTARVDAN